MAPAEALTVPTQSHGVSLRTSASPHRSRRSWQSRLPLPASKGRGQPADDSLSRLSTQQTRRSASSKKSPWWETKLFTGMYNDVKRRAPFYWSDWKDAWDYRVVPATVYMYFAKYVPVRRPNETSVPISCELAMRITDLLPPTFTRRPCERLWTC